MQRWKHAKQGPKCALIVGILLGVASLTLYQSAYAATSDPPYPGSTATPGITNGPSLGCNPTGTTNETWVCGFNAVTSTSFKVNGQAAGSYQADSHGCVLIVLTFSGGEVSVNNNKSVPTHAGTNTLVIEGHKTTSSGTYVVGLRISFMVPHGNSKLCVTSSATTTTTGEATTVPSGSSTTIPHHRTVFTTSTRIMPTTLAKALETPLQISPNKVILESSLLAAVLAALLSAGALGSMWASGAEAPIGGGTAPGGGEGGVGGGEPLPPTGGPSAPSGPSGPSGPAGPSGGGGATSGSTVTRMTSAFVRPGTSPPHRGSGQ